MHGHEYDDSVRDDVPDDDDAANETDEHYEERMAEKRRNEAMERGDHLRDRAKDERSETTRGNQ